MHIDKRLIGLITRNKNKKILEEKNDIDIYTNVHTHTHTHTHTLKYIHTKQNPTIIKKNNNYLKFKTFL